MTRHHGAPRALVVDDHALNLELAAHLLEAAGFDVACVADAAQAQASIAARLPDVILMDVQLPGMDGLELTRRVKADPATRHIAVMAFTAYAMKGDEGKTRAAGCDGYIAKPIDVASFAAQVLACLTQVRARNWPPTAR